MQSSKKLSSVRTPSVEDIGCNENFNSHFEKLKIDSNMSCLRGDKGVMLFNLGISSRCILNFKF